MLLRIANPDEAEDHLIEPSRSRDIEERWRLYEQMVGVERTVPDQDRAAEPGDGNGNGSSKEGDA